MAFHLAGTVLPDGSVRDVWTLGDCITFERPSQPADTLADGGFLLPGLVDVHTHPGSPSEDEPDFEADAFATQVGRQGSFAPAAPSRPDPEGCRPQTPAFGLSGLVLKRRTG